jgi:hypothetical protein
MAAYDAYAWWLSFPRFLAYSARVDRPVLPGANLHGGDAEPARALMERRPAWLRLLNRWILDPYRRCVPYLFALGVLVCLLRWRNRLLALPFAAYFVCYAAVLLLILPESKHWAQLLLPLHVLAPVGLWDTATSLPAWPHVLRDVHSWRRGLARLLPACWLILAWGVAGITTYSISRAQRQRLVDSVLSLVQADEPSRDVLDEAKLFTAHVPGGAAAPPIGYLLKVRGGRRPRELFAIHIHEAAPGRPAIAYWTRHEIDADREQLFFVNVVNGTRIRDERPYTLHVRVHGDARLVSSTRVDLSRWGSACLELHVRTERRAARRSFRRPSPPATETVSVEAVAALLP